MIVKPHPYIRRPRGAVIETWGIKKLCRAYGWPTHLAGGGTIAIVELGGGWQSSDVHGCFTGEVLPIPRIEDVSVDGTTNDFGSNPDADYEVALDIDAAGTAYATATGKHAHIRMYWAQDIASAVRAAANDGCDVCSISWGADEAEWGQTDADDMEAAASYATAQGMVVLAAAGDNDSSDGGPTPANVDCPASCPHVIGCGGTRLLDANGARGAETVWNDNPDNADGEGTGGGYSKFFPPQSWQAGAMAGPGRMVPDVAANADPVTGLHIYLNGQWQIVGGTSGVAPLYAGLIAACGTKLGWITPVLWLNHLAFNLITQGDNGMYRAGSAPSPTCGLGSPIGSKISALFTQG